MAGRFVRQRAFRVERTLRRGRGLFYAELLARSLNLLPSLAKKAGELPRDCGERPSLLRLLNAWRTVAAILEPSLPLLPRGELSYQTRLRFNEFAKRCRIDFELGAARIGGHSVLTPQCTSRDERGEALVLLWNVLENDSLDRLKRCRQCGRWFADKSRNHSGARCSRACTDRWWNRKRRKQS